MKKSLLVSVVACGGLITTWAIWSRKHDQIEQPAVTLQLRAFSLNLDPATMADTESRKVATVLYSGLVAVAQDGSILPRVARAWTQLDATTWQFDIQPDLTFSDGTKVTAAKVVQSLCASMQPSHIQSWSL